MRNSKVIPLIIVASLLTSSCENMTPGENAAVFGGAAAAITGGVLALAGVDPSIALAVGAGAGLLAGGAAFVISKQQATARQRQIALQNARAAEARMIAQQSKSRSSGSSGTQVAKSKKAPASMPKYIAVDTVTSTQSPSGAKPVMLYDTQSRKIVGNDVYNLKSQPTVGSNKKFDTMTAQYVGR
jgi:type II secretory pathway pseudopilin PulG